MILIILISTLLIFTSPVHAQEFTQYQDNPVLKKTSESAGVFQPFVVKNGNVFSAWFADSVGNRAAIATMKSANGIDWYDKKTLQLSSRNSVHDPFMFVTNNEYQLYFASSDSGPISLWKSTSSDGFTFTLGEEREILTPVQPWEQFSVSSPTVIQDQSTYYLFYAGAGRSVWAIGMATSIDGNSWQKCTNNPLVPEGSGPHIIKYNNIFYLFYQSSLGLQVQQTDILSGCNTVWSNRHSISPPFGDPAPVVVGNDLWLYGTYGTVEGQAIGLAGNIQIPQPTYPIILLPGMFASWNKNAILHNTDVSFDTWKMNPAVTEYDVFKQTLQNKNRTENTDFFLFPYDWRKPMEEIISDLDAYLEKKIWSSNPYQPIQIVGHSLGGAITKLYTQKNTSRPIKNIVTAGAPLLGALQSYKPLASGEIDRENTLIWLAEKLVLLLNKSKVESDKETISRMLPILKNLLPAFPYLKNGDGLFIESSFRNIVLPGSDIVSSIKQLYLGGSGYQMNAGYTVSERTPLDSLLDIYPDGHPISSWQEEGDEVILLKSTFSQNDPAPHQNHGEMIYSKESIKTILSSLDIQVADSDIPLGKATTIFPAILVFIQSPATIAIEHMGVTYDENEGMIWMQNIKSGRYNLKVAGTETGEYTASVWLIGADDDKWIQFKKQTSRGKIDEYTIFFDSVNGGTVEEYIAPTATPTPSPTHIPSPTSTDISQSHTSNNTSSQNTTSESKKENADTKKANINISHTLENKKSLIALKKNVPQVLGVTETKKIPNHSPLVWILFAKLIIWGIYAILLVIMNGIKKLIYILNRIN